MEEYQNNREIRVFISSTFQDMQGEREFLIKKVFFDIWDNLLMLVLLSLGFVAPLGLVFLSGFIGEANPAISVILLILAVLAFSMYSLGVNGVVLGYSNYKKGGFRAFKEAFRFHIGHAFLHFGICLAIAFMIMYGIPFYFSMGNYFGLFNEPHQSDGLLPEYHSMRL